MHERGHFLIYGNLAHKIIGTILGGWDGWKAYIYKLAVSQESRRRGIGTRLVNEVARRLRIEGAEIIRAYVEEENEALLSLFKSLGFEQMEDFVIVTQGRQ